MADFDGDPHALRGELDGKLGSIHGRPDVVAKLSHLADLGQRLADAGVTVDDLASFQPVDKATLTEARRKVRNQALDGRALTEAMRDTPAAQLDRRAKYGHWSRFPTNPQRFYDRLGSRRDTHVPKGGSFRVVDAHRRRLQRLDGPRRTLADRLALYRAFHTVGIELAERVTDAYHTYLGVDWAAPGMQPADYWRDLCELLVAENYGLTHRGETAAFTGATAHDVPLIETTLLDLEAEFRAAYQDDQADEALFGVEQCLLVRRVEQDEQQTTPPDPV